MAGSIVTTQTPVALGLVGEISPAPGLRSVVKTSIVWTSDAAGAVSANSTTLPAGSIIAVAFTPGAGGLAPTDLYDVTMTCDSHPAVNILDDGAGTSIGANLSGTNSSHKVPMIGGGSVTYMRQWLHGGGYTLVVAAAGDSNSGTVDIYQCLDVL